MLPVTGEFHYSRYPAAQWEQAILKMKAGGLTFIPTYVFWNIHEEKEGVFDWNGNRDLRLSLIHISDFTLIFAERTYRLV